MDTVASYLYQVGDVCAKVAKFEDCMTITLDCRVASLVQLCMYSGVASVSTKNRGKCEKKSKEKFTGNFCSSLRESLRASLRGLPTGRFSSSPLNAGR